MKVFVLISAIALISLTEAAKAPAKAVQSSKVEQAQKLLTFTCSAWEVDIPSKWIDMVSPCIDAMQRHIQANIDTAFTYLIMASHFNTDTINRPNIAEFFYTSASEKRQVTVNLLKTLLLRGSLSINNNSFITCNNTISTINQWENALEALKYSLALESDLTNKLRSVITTCQTNEKKFNDYNLVNLLSRVHLEHQYSGERNVAKLISSLGKVSHTYVQLGEFMFDKIIVNEKYNKVRKATFKY